MLLRDHPEVCPWPDLNGISTVPPLPTTDEALGLRIQNVRFVRPGIIHIVFNFGGGTCLWKKDFKDAPFAVALYNARSRLIGKSLLEAGDVQIT